MYVHSIRKWAMLMLTFMLVGVLAACGNAATSSSTGSSDTSGTASSSETGQSETITYQASNGEIQLPRNPQRVVEVADSYVGHLLVLGIKPIGVKQQALENPYFEGKLDGVADLGDGQSFEKILELQPDLIIAPGWLDAAVIENYSKIAPTVAIKYGELPLREQLREFGKITGKEAIDSGQGWADLSMEKLPDYAGDYIFTNAWSGDDADPSAVYESSVWKSLPAVQNGMVFTTNRKGDLFNDPVSLEAQLEFILDCLLERK